MSKPSDPNQNLKDIFEKAGMYSDKDGIGNLFDSLFPAKTVRVVTCRACSQKNRLKADKKAPRCGKCGIPLVTT